jgi:hypothetical protein
MVAAVAGEQLYRRGLRERTLSWGATAEEAARSLPGDELLGPGRAGAYTYDWIENLFGLNMHSAGRIHLAWQSLEVGDVLRSGEGKPGMRVEILEPERALVNRSEGGDWVWAFVLVPEDGSTRLISRNRISMRGVAAGQRLGILVMEPGSLVMERKMLRGIKERAERATAGRNPESG